MRVLNGSLAEPCGVTLINSLSSFCSRDREESSRNIHHLSPFSLLFSPLEFVSAFKEPLDCRSAVPQLLAKSPNIRVLTRGAPHPKKILQTSSKHPPSILQASSKHRSREARRKRPDDGSRSTDAIETIQGTGAASCCQCHRG